MTEHGADIPALVEHLVKSLVDSPDQVVVEPVQEDGATVIELEVAPGEVGKIIGKQGRTIKSLRNIVVAAGNKMHKRYELEIVEEE